ncbi:MAG: AbrB/MazE/SpoVT family DNA-binding domain-containing protein [Gemmatimonadota bacterium]
MAVSVKMSSKNQIVVPKEAREALGLRPGDRLVVSVRDDDVIEMERQPRDLGERLEGLLGDGGAGSGLWEELRDG